MIKRYKLFELYADLHKLRPTSKSIGGEELLLVMKERNQELLNKDFTNCWVKITPELGTYFLHIVAWHTKADRTLTFEYDGYFDHTLTLSTLNTPASYNLQVQNNNTEITVYKEKEPKIMKSEKDPYGEEDWEEYMEESVLNEDVFDDDDYDTPKPVLVKDRFLSFGDFLRFDLLGLKKLKELRRFFEDQIVIIEQGTGDKLKRSKGRVHKIRTFKTDEGQQVYLIDMTTKKGEKTIEVRSGSSKFKVKTAKKIKSPSDPYGEEDWELVGDVPDAPVDEPKAGKKAGGKVKPLEDFLKNKKFDKEETEKRLKDFVKSGKASKPDKKLTPYIKSPSLEDLVKKSDKKIKKFKDTQDFLKNLD